MLRNIVIIIDEKMFDFWLEDNEELGYLLMMKDGASYYKEYTTVRKKQLEKDE